MFKFLLATSAAILALSACGQADSRMGSEPERIAGTGQHVITGREVNVRDQGLRTVQFVVGRGTILYPTGARRRGRISGSTYMFYEAWFPAWQQYGWIADASWVQPRRESGDGPVGPIEPIDGPVGPIEPIDPIDDPIGPIDPIDPIDNYGEILYAPQGSFWRVVSSEDRGGVSCRRGPGISYPVEHVVRYGEYIRAYEVRQSERGLSWMYGEIRTSRGQSAYCYVRATFDRLERVRNP